MIQISAATHSAAMMRGIAIVIMNARVLSFAVLKTALMAERVLTAVQPSKLINFENIKEHE